MKRPARECRYLIRFEATASNIVAMKKQLLAMAPNLAPRVQKIENGLSRADRLDYALSDATDAMSEIDGLREEIESWKDSIPENLQSGSKADELDECLSTLESVRDQLDTAIEEARQVSFPGMF